jgi:prolyl-tRNA editing enzyme YbaK/EbsC (Cys-tRNA(Pro) deacylase)
MIGRWRDGEVWVLGYGDRESVRRVRDALAKRGVSPEFVELEETARSARDAAAALGCRVEQIVKSLVFRGANTGGPVLVLASGPNRVSEGRISAFLGEPIEKADAVFVREKAGFAIGGVPPLGHAETPATFLDEDLLEEEEVWAAAGHTHVVFGLDPEELRRITAARAIRVK